MPGAEAMTTSGADEYLESVNPATVPSIEDAKLKNEWRKLKLEIEGKRFETDIEERHSNTHFHRSLELAFANPGSISVSTKPVSRREDMTAHIRGHFESLFNTDSPRRLNAFKAGRLDIDRLLKLCELVYLYDSVYRFSSETIVDPKIDGLERLRFVALPTAVHRWLGEVDILWWIVHGELDSDEPLEEMIDRLYESRTEFVEKAKAAEIFLPIRSDYTEDPERKSGTIVTQFKRNAHVDPKLVHDYCFSKVIDTF